MKMKLLQMVKIEDCIDDKGFTTHPPDLSAGETHAPSGFGTLAKIRGPGEKSVGVSPLVSSYCSLMVHRQAVEEDRMYCRAA